MYLPGGDTNSHVKPIGPMHAANLKGPPEVSDSLTVLKQGVAAMWYSSGPRTALSRASIMFNNPDQAVPRAAEDSVRR